MKIWGRDNSTNVRKVLWCAEELGLQYEHVPAGGAFGVVSTPEFRTLNPNGLVPCLQDGSLVLWESNAIVRYLALQYGCGGFATADARTWAVADKWMDWASLSFAVPFRDLFWNLVRCTPETRDETAMLRGQEQCASLMKVADEALVERPWLSGETLGIGDIPLGCIAYAWFNMPIERPGLPALESWYDRLSQRETYRKAVMTELT
ncbi:MAG: glutathione S-transferase [Pseudomonadota bacterium]|nr:glutathione S-transferase [Pseudomonadota bacterium]